MLPKMESRCGASAVRLCTGPISENISVKKGITFGAADGSTAANVRMPEISSKSFCSTVGSSRKGERKLPERAQGDPNGHLLG